ncbi:hypothetical protein GHNINEIG_01743 [Hydrogenovibrio crunogenus]|uniref:Uncharacterized protein n=1 Tax=Hydrogenovibrio crunogenus TaxID=39765 RepID=A0A4P7P2W9_9GAMM|nr:hypothetical protein [Hydrogenovibrio crunogenus]QBZ83682.1 hypothetical protein GHNINEIG_01743 [Hydrogenovibrio crunogenus]
MAENISDQNEQLQEDIPLKPQTPTAEEMLERLHAVDVEDFDLEQRTNELKGNNAWLFVLTMPATAILLVLFTLLGTFLTDHFIISFILSAGVLFVIGKMIDQYEQKFKYQARLDIMQRIKETETDAGLIPHFRDFLPKKYRHLWQSLKKQNYIYIDQYIAALTLLQQRLDDDKFIRVWRLKYPETAPDEEEEDLMEAPK